MIQWFMSTGEGGHIGKTGVKIIPVRAFRIEPIRPSGYMSVDAESVPFGASQGQILPGKGRVYVSDKRTWIDFDSSIIYVYKLLKDSKY